MLAQAPGVGSAYLQIMIINDEAQVVVFALGAVDHDEVDFGVGGQRHAAIRAGRRDRLTLQDVYKRQVFGVLDNLVMDQMILEISYRHEMVVDAVLLTLTRGAGGGGDGVLDLRVFFQQACHDLSLIHI